MIDLYHLQILAVHLVLSIDSFPQPQRDVECVYVWVIQVNAWGGAQGCNDVWAMSDKYSGATAFLTVNVVVYWL